jgi:hypothetical protein
VKRSSMVSTTTPASRALGVVAEDNREKVVAAQRLELELAGGPYRGRPWDALEQRDLSKRFPFAQPADQASVSDHPGHTGLDHVEAVADVALAEHHLTCRHRDWLQAAHEMFDGGEGKGLNMGTACNRPISLSRTPMNRSSRCSRCHEAANSIGQRTPMATSARRMPDSSIISDALVGGNRGR